MSVRVSESWTAPNGHRLTVSMGLGTYLLGSVARCFSRGLLIGLFLFPLMLAWWELLFVAWVSAWFLLFIVTGAATIAAVARREGKCTDITLVPAKWHLFMIGLKGAR